VRARSARRRRRSPRRTSRVRDLGTDVKRKPLTRTPSARASDSSGRTATGSQPNLRDRSTTAAGCGTRRAPAARRACDSATNLRISSGLSTTNVRMPNLSAARISESRLDRMCLDAALSLDAAARTSGSRRPSRRRSSRLVAKLRDDRRVRQRLQRVVELDPGSARFNLRY
jgi:hypothetical protein